MTASATRSYRDSHRTKDKAEKYVAEYLDASKPAGILWGLEQEILTEFFGKHDRAFKRALDFACGTGRVTGLVTQYVPDVVGIDISPEMLDLARTAVPSAKFVTGDLTRDSALVPGPFDLVTAFRFFLEADDDLRIEALQAIRKRLTHDGLLIANFHRNPMSIRGGYAVLSQRLRGKRMRTFTLRQATRMLESNGFAVDEVHGYMHLMYRGAPRGPVVWRKRIDGWLRKRPFLRGVGQSFILIARPRTS